MKALLFLLAILPATVLGQEKSYCIVFLNSKPDAERIDKETQTRLFKGHMANIERLAKEGKLLAAGPFNGGGGLFIFNTASLDEAESWVNTDPAVQAKRWNIEILPFTPRTGSVCPVKEIQMVNYFFVRFNAIVEKFTAANYPTLIRQHEAYVRDVTDSLSVVSEGVFGPNEGGILIVKDSVASDAFSNDPGVQQGLLDVQVKKLFIAKGSFCEK
jgi:uncharacterized protein YciI